MSTREDGRLHDLIDTHLRIVALGRRKRTSLRIALMRAVGTVAFSDLAWRIGPLLGVFYDHPTTPLLPLTLLLGLTKNIFGSIAAIAFALGNAAILILLNRRGSSMIAVECLGWLLLSMLITHNSEAERQLDRMSRKAFVYVQKSFNFLRSAAISIASIPSR